MNDPLVSLAAALPSPRRSRILPSRTASTGGRLRCLTLLVGLLAMFPYAAAARGSSLVFTRPDGNVWLANPDGSGQYQVTLDGSAASPYSSPSQATFAVLVSKVRRAHSRAWDEWCPTSEGTTLETGSCRVSVGSPVRRYAR